MAAFPTLTEEGQLPLDLIAAESRIRSRGGDSPQQDEDTRKHHALRIRCPQCREASRVSKDKATAAVSRSPSNPTAIPGKKEPAGKLDHPHGYSFAQDGEVAQWVLGIGGRIGISTGRALPSLVSAVPEGQFRLLLVDLSSNTKWQPSDLSRLKDLGAIQVCSLAYGQASNESLAEIQALRQLRYLNLWACPVGDEACKFLAKLKSLQWLNLGDTGISYAGLLELETLQGLRNLHLEKIRRADCGLEPLVKLQSLESLSLSESEVNDDDLALVSQLPNLRHLQLGRTKITDVGLAKLLTQKNWRS